MKNIFNQPIRQAILGIFTVITVILIALALPTAANAAKGKAAADQKNKGKVTAVSSTSITIHDKKTDKDSTFTVSSSTKVKVDKVASTISAVTVGMHADVLSADGKTADAIHAHAATHTKKDKA